MNLQDSRDKVRTLFESGITDCMEISRRTGIAKSIVYRTVDKILKNESVTRKVGSGKQCQILANNARSHVGLVNNNPNISIRKLTCRFNKIYVVFRSYMEM